MLDDLTKKELTLLRSLSTPAKIQDFLETLAINFEQRGETLMSPRRVLHERKAHCFEGALLAAAALHLQGQKPLIMDLMATDGDDHHVIALFKQGGLWGSISKTNHAVLRYREPIYRTVRELAASFFHEYFKDNGAKTLRSYSRPLNLNRFDRKAWMTAPEDLWYIDRALDHQRHYSLISPAAAKSLRLADGIEIAAGKLTEWDKNGKRSFTNKRR